MNAKLLSKLAQILFLALIWTVILFSVAFADGLVPLSNQKMLSILNDQGYYDMQFYQPSIQENDSINSSSDSYLYALCNYPIVGIQGNRITLFILKKQGTDWWLQIVSNKALNREHLSLSQFSMDESYETDGYQNVHFQYILENEESNELTLTLVLSDSGASYFSRMHTGRTDFHLNYERGITLTFHYSFYGRYAFEIIPRQYIPFGVNEFDFSLLPLSALDFLESAHIIPEKGCISLYYFPDDTSLPVLSVESDEEIQVFPNYSSSEWNLTYYNNGFFFVHAEDLQPAVN